MPRAIPVMDNREFDHIVKGKLESVLPSYNEEAWGELAYKLDLIAPMPWYARWKSAMIAAALGLITLINVGVWYQVNQNQTQMQQILDELNNRDQQVPENLYVTTSDNYLGSSLSTSLTTTSPLGTNDVFKHSQTLLDPLSIYRINAGKPTPSAPAPSTTYGSGLAAVKSPGIVATDRLDQALDQATNAYFSKLASRSIDALDSKNPFQQSYALATPDGEDMYVRGIVVPATKNKWEHPLSLRVGLATGYFIPDPDLGERFVSSRQSLVLESPIGGNLHGLTGLSYQEMIYKLDDVDDNNFSQETLLRYPDFNSFDNTPDEIRVENQVLQIPLHVRYYRPLNNKWSVFVGGGPTLDLLLKQKFIYSFLEIQNEQLVEFEEVRTRNDVSLSIGSLAGSVGIEHYFGRRLSAQMELNYQYGLGRQGVERRSFNSLSITGGMFYKLGAR